MNAIQAATSIPAGTVAAYQTGSMDTIAGSVATMDRVFAVLVGSCGVDLPNAARMCATTPARELGLVGYGTITVGAQADLTVLTPQLRPLQTWIGGRPVWKQGTATGPAAS